MIVAIITATDWILGFELMCDANDYVIKVVLGKRKTKVFHDIHYTWKVLNETKVNYATREKWLLAIVYFLSWFQQFCLSDEHSQNYSYSII